MKKLFTLIFLYIFTFQVSFGGAAEKWEIVENLYDQSSQRVNVTARKITQEAANSGVYKVKVPVNASVLGATAKSMLWTGVAVAALEALIGAVGWIIDEGSKTIKKLDPEQPPNPPYIWVTAGWTQSTAETYVNSANLFAKAYCKAYGWGQCSASNFVIKSLTSVDVDITDTDRNLKIGTFSIQKKPNPNYNPNIEPRYVPVSDQELGDEIMGNGTDPKSRPTPDSGIITQAYDPNNPASDAPAPEATNDALNSANPEPETDPTGETKPKPNVDTDGDGKPDVYDPNQPDAGQEFTLPPACDWFPAACDFFKVQKQDNIDIKQNQEKQLEQDKTFFEKVTDFFDWAKEDSQPDNDDTEVDIQQDDAPQLDTNIFNASGECPPDFSYPFPLPLGGTYTITYSYATACYWFSKLYYIVVTVASLISIRIVSGTEGKSNG